MLTHRPLATRRRCRASSITVLSFVRHQRSSLRGSFGTSQNNSHKWDLSTGRGANAKYPSSARTLREAGMAMSRPWRVAARVPSSRNRKLLAALCLACRWCGRFAAVEPVSCQFPCRFQRLFQRWSGRQRPGRARDPAARPRLAQIDCV